MNITVNIRPEVEAELARQATASGCAIEAHAATLLEAAVDLPTKISTEAVQQKRDVKKSLADVCAMVRGLTDDLDFSRNPSTDRPVDFS